MEIMYLLTIFVLASFVGYFVIRGITPSLHSPLMSVSNAISGIVVVGAIISFESAENFYAEILSLSAIFLAAINIFGGFALSERMLVMFHRKNTSKGRK